MKKIFIIDGTEVEVHDLKKMKNAVSFTLNGEKHVVTLKNQQLFHKNILNSFVVAHEHVLINNQDFQIRLKKRGALSAKHGAMIAPMPCKVFKLLKKVGDKIAEGETILILEAMKMEHAVKSDKDGVIEKIHFSEGEMVASGALLVDVS